MSGDAITSLEPTVKATRRILHGPNEYGVTRVLNQEYEMPISDLTTLIGGGGGGWVGTAASDLDMNGFNIVNTSIDGALHFGPSYNAHIVSDGDGGINIVDQGGNALTWNPWDWNGLMLNSKSITMNQGGGSGGGDILMDGGSIIIPGTGGWSYIKTGTYGSAQGISLVCAVGYELNWQNGHLGVDNGANPIIMDSNIDMNGHSINSAGDISGSYLIGDHLILATLPTSDPSVLGAVWNDTGTLKISSGPGA
jgi:hypothetical protein